MTVVELRDELDKLIAHGHGNRTVMLLNSPDDFTSGEWEEVEDVHLALDKLVHIR